MWLVKDYHSFNTIHFFFLNGFKDEIICGGVECDYVDVCWGRPCVDLDGKMKFKTNDQI